MTEVKPVNPANADMEKLAELAHIIWTEWTVWMLEHLDDMHVETWWKQCNTPYTNLTEREKESDRKIVLRWIDAVHASGCLPAGRGRPHYVVMSLDWWNKQVEELRRLQGEVSRLKKLVGEATDDTGGT